MNVTLVLPHVVVAEMKPTLVTELGFEVSIISVLNECDLVLHQKRQWMMGNIVNSPVGVCRLLLTLTLSAVGKSCFYLQPEIQDTS